MPLNMTVLTLFSLSRLWSLRRFPVCLQAGSLTEAPGYEEAAVQGFMAGVNAVMKIRGQEAVVSGPFKAYIGF